MPLHTEITAPVLVSPFQPEEGVEGKELILPVSDAGVTFHYKMTAELATELASMLAMTNEELTEHHRKQALAASLRVPSGIDLSKLNGGQG